MPKLAIYAGHGGKDAGACYNGWKEKDYTLNISNEVTAILRHAGFEIINNRTTDVNRSINNDAKLANNNNVDAVIEFHFNAGGGNGTETYHSVTGGTGKELAKAINARIANLGFKDRGIKTKVGADRTDYFGIIRQTKAPAVLVEICFIDSIGDMDLYHATKDMANHIADAIYTFFGGHKSTPKPQPQPQPQPQQNSRYAQCNCDTLNVRDGGSTSNRIIGYLKYGNEVQVLDTRGDWYYINFGGRLGWASAKYLTIGGVPGQYAQCNGNRVNVRNKPSMSGSVIRQLNKGNEFKVTGRSGKWCRVIVAGTGGYVYSQYVSIGGI